MIPNPIHKVLATLYTHDVRYLLMGGQACVYYGAAEFSRSCDIAILSDDQNIERLRGALIELEAEPIAVPPFRAEYLERGHAIHFRCQAQGAAGVRLDVMARMRGVASFEELWTRRTTLEVANATKIEIMGLSDLVISKMTHCDQDWPVIRCLVESNYAQFHEQPSDEQIRFWLKHGRTAHIIKQVSSEHAVIAHEMSRERPLLSDVHSMSHEEIDEACEHEEKLERDADRRYWQPLEAELEAMQRKPPRP